MNSKRISIIIISLLLTIGGLLITNCANDDMAIVTIHLQRNDLASVQPQKEKSIIDRILEFFSTPSFAGGWQSDWATMSYSITGPDMESIVSTTPLPSGTTEFSIEVPAGPNRTITITTFNSSFLNANNWGGRTTVNLNAGQETNITIKMIPMTVISGGGATGMVSLFWQALTSQYNFSRYIIYKSTNENGPYSEYKRISNYLNSSDTDYDVIGGVTYYYRIAIESDADGMGLMSDALSATPL